MRIGFTGAHRSGKTTLAKLVSAEYKIPMVDSPASAIVKSFGFDMAKENRLDFAIAPGGVFETGVDMQQEIYRQLVSSLAEAGNAGHFVSDRTPIDVAAYLLADATGYAGTPKNHAQVMEMVNAAILETARLFDLVILVPPGIQFIAEDGKPPINEAYQEHHHMLCRGMLFDEDLDLYWDELRRTTHTIDARMDFVRGTIAQAFSPLSAAA